jgi:coronin-1B/1C/6
MLRLWDTRQAAPISEVQSHLGVKGSRVVWLFGKNRMLTTGFGRTSDRQFYIWDPTNLAAPLHKEDVDTSAGLLMPFYDADTGVLFLAGKGDGNIRLMEMIDDKPFFYALTEHKSNVPQRGICLGPKMMCNVGECEIARVFKLTRNGTVDPISFKVPRKAAGFQPDIFPDTASNVPALSAKEYFDDGVRKVPLRINMETLMKGEVTTTASLTVSSAPKQVASPAPAATNAANNSAATSALEEKAKAAEAKAAALQAEVDAWKEKCATAENTIAQLRAELEASKSAAAALVAGEFAATATEEPAVIEELAASEELAQPLFQEEKGEEWSD